MDNFNDVLNMIAMTAKDAVIDTLKIVPFLFLIYFLIELLEYKNVFRFENSKLLKGKASPALGACMGCIPQCGFSVISADLFAEQKISMAALVAVFIATSDEAFPVMLADYHLLPSLAMLIVVKLAYAILVGYLTYFLSKKLFKPASPAPAKSSAESGETETHEHIHACCNHDPENQKFDWKHPLIHCAKISLYLLIINFVMGIIVAGVGEQNIYDFLGKSHALQPLLATLVGLIPNCASSVILTELYMAGGLSFGAIVAGLSVNAGIGFLVLFKKNKNLKQNLFILSVVIVSGLAIGYALHFVPLNFLRI